MAKKDTVTGIVVKAGVVEWSVVRPDKSGLELVTDGVMHPDDLRSAALDGTLDKTVFPTPGQIGATVLAMPSERLLLRILELPIVDDEDLAGMVELQIDKYAPFPLDQMVVSHEIIERGEDSIKLLVAAAREKDVDEAAQLLSACGIKKIKRIDALVMGVWDNIVAGGMLNTEGAETLVLVSDGSVEVLVHDSGVLKAVSCLGAIEGLEKREVAVDIAGEIANLLVTMNLDGVHEAVQGEITLWSDLDGGEFGTALEQSCGRKVEQRWMADLPRATYGVARRQLAGGQLLDLTLSSWRSAEMNQREKRRLAIIAMGVLAVWVLVVAGIMGLIEFEKMQLNKLKAADDALAGPANKVRHLRLQANMIARYTDRTYSSLEVLREISRLQPQGVDLTSFTYRKGEGVTIDGEADSGNLVNRFNEALNGSKLFAEVKSGARTLTKKGRHRFSFAIKFPEVSQ